MENKVIQDRLARLRVKMNRDGVDGYLIPTADDHSSEYVADHYKVREFYSGFTGSAGTLIVLRDCAALWADGRYYIQAEHEIDGTGIDLMRMGEKGVPTCTQYLLDHLKEGDALGMDGRCTTKNIGMRLASELSRKNISLNVEVDPAAGIWTDRPPVPSHPVWILHEKYCGESTGAKVERLRTFMRKKGAACYITGKLDDIMWLFNIRGNDVECNPVAMSYAFITEDSQHLFIQNSELDETVKNYLYNNGVTVHPYDAYGTFIARYHYQGPVMYDPDDLSFPQYLQIRSIAEKFGMDQTDVMIEVCSPIAAMKSVKNETEISNLKSVFTEDSVAFTKFIYWLKNTAGRKEVTEGSAAKMMDSLRAKISDYVELSFPTISAYGSNAAMMHYEPGEDGGAKLLPEGMLLVDCGGQYLRGTTDGTRTISVGKVSGDMRRDYTLTAISNLQLMDTIFLKGCSGIALDIRAREIMWRNGMDYKCGTGHGIGYLLNVHEGPQVIRFRKRDAADLTEFAPGMIVSDEPGVYKAGQYGIRIETILLCVPAFETSDGSFYKFEPLTFVPFDRELLDPQYLDNENLQLLNRYQKMCAEKLSPYLEGKELEWLMKQTAAIEK